MGLLQRKTELERNMLTLECSDDRLFSNGNGNYPSYQAMAKELREIDVLLNGESK